MAMDLGKSKLLRNGLNALHQAIHPVHGLAWTDGKQVVLTPLHLEKEEPRFGDYIVLGQFDHVHGLNWGAVVTNDIPALLAVQHKKHVTVWQLCYNPLEKNKLAVSQTCEMRDPFPVLSQGSIWHPSKDILVVLTKRDISVLYSVRYNSDNVKADIKSTGVIHCACWTKDGSRLVAAIDSTLHSYIWDDIQKTLTVCSFCPMFDLDAKILTIEPLMDYQVVVTTENPKVNFYSHNKEIDLDVSSLQSSLLVLDEELSRHNRRKSIDSGKSEPVDMIKSSTLVPSDIAQILAKHRKSDPSPLIHVRHKNFTPKYMLASSNLIIVSFQTNATTTRKVTIPGISVPDILVLDAHAQRAIIASNACNVILVYPITPFSMSGIQEIKLDENEKTKGICLLKDHILLIMVGRQKSNDMTFMPLSCSDRYMINLITKVLLPIENNTTSFNGGQDLTLDHVTNVSTLVNKTFCEEQTLSKEHLIPSNADLQPPYVRKRIGQVARSFSVEASPTSSISDSDENKTAIDSFLTIESFDTEPTNRWEQKMNKATIPRKVHGTSQNLCLNITPGTFQSMGNTTTECNKKDSVPIMKSLDSNGSIPANKQCCFSKVEEFIMDFTKTHLYPSCEDPHYISIVYQTPTDSEVPVKKSILLCHGKLQLKRVQEIFNLNDVEMKLGTMWIVLTEDREGFVPLTFKANQEFVIRDAKKHNNSYSEYCANHIGSIEPAADVL